MAVEGDPSHVVCRVACMSVTQALCAVCSSTVDQEFTGMVRTQSKNKEDIEVSKDLQKDVDETRQDMYDEVASGRMVIPDLSNNPFPHSNKSPP